MISCPNVLLIGAAGRNVGKTELACEVIRRHAPARQVVGVKVTVIRERGGVCPRGGEGCGVCTSLEEPFSITRESSIDGVKDTSRMLRAGAREVLWLRVRHEHLGEGMRALIERIPAGALVVCESNSAREAIAPGLFLVVRRAGAQEIKPSCEAVIHLADRVLGFHGDGWDLDPGEIAWAGDRWLLRPRATAIILAGGESQRMGEDKSLLQIGGRPMIARIAEQLAFFPEVIIGANDPGKYSFLGLPVVPDRERGKGPLMGIFSCLERASNELAFVTGCDIPSIDPGFVLHLLALAPDHDIVIPRLDDGRTEPMLALYRKSIAPVAEELLRSGQRRIIGLLGRVRVRHVPFDRPAWYGNLNTAEDYRRWISREDTGD